MSLKKITMTKKVSETLTAATKSNKQVDKYTEDMGDLAFYTSTDGKTRYLRVWDSSAPAGQEAVFYEVTPGIGQTRTPLETK